MARGESAKPRSAGKPAEVEQVDDPTRPRAVVNHGLQRRSALRRLFGGGGLSSDLCDADTYLLRAAKHHGEPASAGCPACRDDGLVTVTYVYGDELGPYSGRIRKTDELPSMARRFGRFSVYVVEVCGRCHWNFLLTTYVLGDGVPRRALPTPRDLLD
jgi:hypothetical protein